MNCALLVTAVLAGCYSPPEPDCGFVCGAGNACPADYTCAADHHCQRNGAPASVSCGPPPADAAVDAIDAPVRPMVTGTTPRMGESGVGVAVKPVAYFDQPITAGPQDMYAIHNNMMIPGTATVMASGLELHLVTDVQLPELTSVGVRITDGVKNAQGVSIEPYSWEFETNGDFVQPHLQSSMPASNDTAVPVTTSIRVRFDEPVVGVDATSFTALDGTTPVVGTIATIDTRTFELQPPASLSSGSTITVSLTGAIKDLENNALSPVTFTFTTAP
jgi:hypothetical protein